MNIKTILAIIIVAILSIVLVAVGVYYISQQEEVDNNTPPDPEAPIADAGGPYSATLGDSITLDGSGSTDDGIIVYYNWDIDGDGNSDYEGETISVNTDDEWTSSGTYEISLTVTDTDEKTDTDTTEVILSEIEHCGNGICEPEYGENCENCPNDCGSCQPDVTSGVGIRRPLTPVSNGDTFWVDVYGVPDSYDFGTFKITINYDSSKLQYVEHEPSSSWSDWWYAGTHTTGTLSEVQSMNTNGMTSKGNFFRIKFTAIDTGTANINFGTCEFTNSAANDITVQTTDNAININ